MKQKAANQTIKQPIAMYKGHTGWKVKTRVFGTLLVSLSAVAIAQSTGVTEAHAATPAPATSSVQQEPAGSQPATSTAPSVASTATSQSPTDGSDDTGDYPVLSADKDVNVGADTSSVSLKADQVNDHFTVTVENRGSSDQDDDPTDNKSTKPINSDGSVSLTTNNFHPYHTSATQSTSIQGHQVAHVAFEHEIDFGHNFSMSGALGIGSKSNGGADSVGIIFAPGEPETATHGGSGGKLGLGDLKNAFGFIFDEYSNPNFYDPSTSPYVGWRTTDASGNLQRVGSLSDWKSVTNLSLNSSRSANSLNKFTMNYDADTQTLTIVFGEKTFTRQIADTTTGYSISIAASTGGSYNDYSAEIDNFTYTPKTIKLGVKLVDSAEQGALLDQTTVKAVANIGDTISIFSTQAAAKRALAADPTLNPALVAVIPSDSAKHVYVIDGSQVVANKNGTVHHIGGADLANVADDTYYSYTVTDGDNQEMTVPVRLAYTAEVTPVDAVTQQPIPGLGMVKVVAVEGEPALVSIPGYTPTKLNLPAPATGESVTKANLPIDQGSTKDATTTTTAQSNPIGHPYTASGKTVDGKVVQVTTTVGTDQSVADALNKEDLDNNGDPVTSSAASTPIGHEDYYWSAAGNASATDPTRADQTQTSDSLLLPSQTTLDYWAQQAAKNQTTAKDYRDQSQTLYDQFEALKGLTQEQKDAADALLKSVVQTYDQVLTTNGEAQADFDKATTATDAQTIYQNGQDGYAALEEVKNLLVSFKGDLDTLTTKNQDAKNISTTFKLKSASQVYGDALPTLDVSFGDDFSNVPITDAQKQEFSNPDYFYYIDTKNPTVKILKPTNVGSYIFMLTDDGRDYLKSLSSNANAGLYLSATLTITPKSVVAKIDGKQVTYGGGVDKKFPAFTGSLGDDNTPDPSDFEVVDADGNQVSVSQLVVGGKYTIRYTDDAQKALKQNANYDFTSFGTATLDVIPRPITITAQDKAKTYGDKDPDLTFTDESSQELVNGDTVAEFGIQLVRESGTDGTTRENAGTYDIDSATKPENPSYQITFVPGHLTIAKKSIMIQATTATKIFGQADPNLTFSIPETTKNGDPNGALMYQDNQKDLGVTLTRDKGNNVGPYIIHGTASNNTNYDVTVEPGNFSIIPATASVSTAPAEMIYGENLPDFSATTTVPGSVKIVDPTDFKVVDENDNPVTTELQAGGKYKIQLTAAAQKTLRDNNPNYTFAKPTWATLTVNKRPVTIQITPQEKYAGDQNPENAMTVVPTSKPLKAGDSLDLTYAENPNPAVGVTEIDATSANLNYDVTVLPGTLTVLGKDVAKDGTVTIVEKDQESHVIKVTKQWPDGKQTVYTFDPDTGVKTVTESDIKSGRSDIPQKIAPSETSATLPDGNGGATVITFNDTDMPDFTHYGPDPDHDGISSEDELKAGTDPTSADTDGDGVSDGDELKAGTNPLSADTDGDGVSDGDELKAGTDPLSADTDGDGVSDGDELKAGTNPLSVDTDGDGVSDGDELKAGTDPLSADTDGDGVSDGEEIKLGTNPLKADTDGDGVSDGEEIKLGTDPLKADTDGDGVSDGEEIKLGTDPLKADTDGDGLTDGEELKNHTNPLKPDTDGDGINDGDEIRHHTNPLRAEARQAHGLKQSGHTKAMRHAQQRQSIQDGRKQMTLPQTSQKDESFLAILGAILLSGLLLPFTYKRH